MTSVPSTTDDRTVSRLLADLRRRIRLFVLAEAVLLALIFLGVVFWGGLLLDWVFEPSPAIRLAAHVLVAAVVAGVLGWYGFRRWAAGLPDQSLALLIERKHPELSDVLSSAVAISSHSQLPSGVHPQLAKRTVASAAEAARNLHTGNLLNRVRLKRFALMVGALVLSVAALGLALPHIWHTYTHRLALSPEAWPRTVDLSIEGFEPDGNGGYVRKVARNSDVPIVVEANLTDGFKAPERVTIRYRWQEGRRGRDDLVRIGDAVAGRDERQPFEYLFERLTSDVEFDIRGGDDRLRELRIEVVERPKVMALQFNCTYPAYLDRADRTLPVGPRIELPEGTRFVVAGKANKPLEQVRWLQSTTVNDEPVTSDEVTSSFSNEFELGDSDIDLQVVLLDQDGIESAEPFRVTVVARRDQKPQVLVNRQGIGTAVTSVARLPVEISITDDNAVDSSWIELQQGERALPRIPVGIPPAGANDLVTSAVIDLRELATELQDSEGEVSLAPGQQFTLNVSAQDKHNLSDASRSASARSLSFEIVTEDDLMTRLNSSEQNLRQTFESIADKLLLLYGSLEKLEGQSRDATASDTIDDDLLVVDTGESAAVLQDGGSRSRLPREAGSLAENARQMSDEILGVAAGFEDIHAQLFNNRIENSELSDRIGNRIAAPLRQLGEDRMQSVAQQIGQLAEQDPDFASAKAVTRAAIADVETLLREMQGLENYNEVIAMLRDIIRQQEQINTKTKEQQKSEVRNLLLE